MIFYQLNIFFIINFLYVEDEHRGFGFIEFESQHEAQDAIDNMDLNVVAGKIIKCNYAKPLKAAQMVGQGNK